jgi:lipopolysaccharide/colanic/teichoic acid biosynthesis glycosyltransferase
VQPLITTDLGDGEFIVQTTLNDQPVRADASLEDVAVPAYFTRKTILIRIIGAVLLVFASPIILLLVLIVRMTSPGAGLYRQARTGRYGKEFQMYKIRTMYENAESISGPVWCIPNDSRITPIGRFLRLLHLDELPQLINVARGEMDLVGPRPERPVFVARLERRVPNYRSRLQILPGVTGLAQVNLPPDETIDCVHRKLFLDRAYIREAGLSMDARILLCTLLRMIGIRHGRSVRWLRLEREVHLPADANQQHDESFSYRPPCTPTNSMDDEYAIASVNGLPAMAVAIEGGSGRSMIFPPGETSVVSPRLPR